CPSQTRWDALCDLTPCRQVQASRKKEIERLALISIVRIPSSLQSGSAGLDRHLSIKRESPDIPCAPSRGRRSKLKRAPAPDEPADITAIAAQRRGDQESFETRRQLHSRLSAADRSGREGRLTRSRSCFPIRSDSPAAAFPVPA